jgi:hypothetical protein
MHKTVPDLVGLGRKLQAYENMKVLINYSCTE